MLTGQKANMLRKDCKCASEIKIALAPTHLQFFLKGFLIVGFTYKFVVAKYLVVRRDGEIHLTLPNFGDATGLEKARALRQNA